MPDDHAASIRTDGSVAVGGSAAGDIETARDRDWFAVELVAGRTYVFDLEGSPTGAGTLSDTYLRGIHDANGNRLSGTTNDDGGTGTNSRLTFTATESGTHYVATEAYGSGTGTYELSVRDTDPDTIPEPDTTPVAQTPPQTQAPADADAVRTGATDLGDITGLAGPAFPTGRLDDGADAVDYFRFTLTEAKGVHFGLRQQETDADLFLESEDGTVIVSMTTAGTANEELPRTLLAGTYFVRIEAQEAGASTYVFRYGVTAADPEAVRELKRLLQEGNAGQVPAFGQQDYVLALAENADGSTGRVSLGTVSATDPEGVALAYSLVDGNDAGLFGIDAASGNLFYAGPGEDFESGSTPFELTVRASDGTLFADMTVTGNVTDLPEQAIVEAPIAQTPHQAGATDLGDITGLAGPAFPTGTLDGGAGAVDYFRFTLTEAKRIGLGLRQQDTNADLFLEDAEGNVLACSTEAGMASEEIGETLLAGTYYVRIETQEAGQNDYVFRYGVTAADPVALQQMETSDYSTDAGTAGRVAPGGSATGDIGTSGDQDWFAVELSAGTHYRIDLEGRPTGDGTLGDPYLRGIYDSNGQRLSGTTEQ